MLRVLLFLLIVGLYVYVFIDLATARGDDVRALPRPVWLLVILVVPVLGAVAWLAFGRPLPQRGGGGGLGGLLGRPRPGGSPSPRPRPVAPDDDPDFLRKLDEERRRTRDPDSTDSPD